MFGKKNLMLMLYVCIIGAILLVIPLSITYDPDPYIAEIEVGPDLQIRSIQQAINMADEGTTIIVHQGVYKENLLINKGLTIKAAPGEKVTLMGDGRTRGSPDMWGSMEVITSPTPVTRVGFDYLFVNGTTWNDSAIKIQNGDNHVFKNCNFSNSKQGIWVHGNDHEDLSTIKNIRILDCRFTNLSGHAIYLQGTWAEVENNYINNSGDGIMVAFDWIAPNPQVGSIRDNRIENCSVGVNIVDSVVYNYEGNEIVDCEEGELLNSTTLESTGNTFTRCWNGTKVIDNSTPQIMGNTYIDCENPVVIDRCTGVRAYENMMTGTNIGFKPIYDELEHLDHDIAQNNTIDGRPVYYSFGDIGEDHDLNDYGQVFIANSSHSSYSIKNPSPCLTNILFSTDVDIGGSRLTTGLNELASDIFGEDVVIGNQAFPGTPLLMGSSDARIFNSTIEADPGVEDGVVLSGGSNLDMFSSSMTGEPNLIDSASRVDLYSYIGLKVLHQDEGVPVEGANYEFKVDDVVVHASSLFEGSDPETDPDGIAGPFWINYETLTMSSDIVHGVDLTVNATADRSFQGNRSVDGSEDHVEEFIIGDILRPSIPANLQGEAVANGEANRLTWDANTDDTVSYRIYYSLDGNWSLAGEVTGTEFDHTELPDGTLAFYQVTAVDEVGLESLPSVSVEVLTEDSMAPSPPRELRIYDITDDSFTLSWKKSLSPDVVLYEVHLVEADITRAPGSVKSSIRMIDSTTETTIVIQGMSDPDNKFAVRALDEADNPSGFSNPVSLEASDLTWPTISDIEWIKGAKSAKLSWKTDEPTECTVWFGSSIEDLSSYGPTALGNDHSYQMRDLSPNTTYYFYIHAVEPSGNDVIDDNEGQFYSFTTLASEGYMSLGITDQDNEPVSGVTVLASQGETQVRVVEVSVGVYEAFLVPGNWTISIVSSDHSPYDPFDVEILPFQWTNTTIQLSSILWEKANLTITVVDETGNTVPGAVIEFEGKDYTTGPGGKVTINGVATGKTYTIKISADGFETVEKEVSVPAKGKDQEETFTIIHEEGGPDGGGLLWIMLLILAIIFFLMVFVIILVVLKRKQEPEPEPRDLEEEHEQEDEAKEEEEEIKEGSIEDKPDLADIGVTEAIKKPVKKKAKKEKTDKKEKEEEGSEEKKDEIKKEEEKTEEE